ncbi:brix domain-containing protein c [Pyronema domesticum]|uniref:Similar to Brix domain-containing protein C1B9.03c acc. no. O14206 n=1 Tax=Pyronema omphalodes (strain CBS 100304) TaxID=1076935 RepID=U4LV86_PYROM|nr:brix domain-containing protein c [Pyronema domesticum]CCX32311.1 Similar to Brix domain-containing protein C1B9.03c; acc. no. O14206 [Pyronema omphalodes CBS 100304]
MARGRTKKRTHLPDPTTTKLPHKQTNTGVTQPLNASASPIPKTMVIRIGASEIGSSVSTLVKDVRQMMEPHTASRLRERKSNRLKDYVTMAGPLGVTQLLLFSRSETGHSNLRITRCPRGPTLHFRINEYSLCKDVRKALRNPKSPGKEFATPPLLVMNNFATPVPKNPDGTPGRAPPQDALLTSMFQSMFPAISAQRTPIASIKRVLLLNRRPVEEGSNEYIIDVRHYAISTKTVGVSRAIRRINNAEKRVVRGNNPDKTKSKKGALPNLGKLEDISEYMLDPNAAAGGYTSESEVEEDAQVEVLNPAVRGAKRKKTPKGPEKKSIHLVELGPRMTLEMTKIEEGLADGKTLWHAYEKKSKEEIHELEKRHAKKQQEKDKRRKEQQANVAKKKEALDAKRKEKQARKARGEEVDEESDEEIWDDEELDQLHEDGDEVDDDDEDEEMEE